AFLKSGPQPRIPHLAGIHAPRIQNIRMPGDNGPPEIQKLFVPFHRVVSLAIHDGDRTRVFVRFRVQLCDQLVELFQIGVIGRLVEGINDDRMNFGTLRRPGFSPGLLRSSSFGWRGVLHKLRTIYAARLPCVPLSPPKPIFVCVRCEIDYLPFLLSASSKSAAQLGMQLGTAADSLSPPERGEGWDEGI